MNAREKTILQTINFEIIIILNNIITNLLNQTWFGFDWNENVEKIENNFPESVFIASEWVTLLSINTFIDLLMEENYVKEK